MAGVLRRDPMALLSFINDDSLSGEGVSLGIPRGMMVRRDGSDLTQEGLGLGAIALRRRGITYFPTLSRTSIDGSQVSKQFTVDSALVFSSPVLPLSRLMPLYSLGTRAYMMLPRCQERLLGLRSRMFSWLRVRPELRRTRVMAEAMFTYTPQHDSVTVRGTVRSLNGPLPKVFVMNELGADHFSSSVRDGRIGPPPTGWCRLPDELPSAALLDEKHGTTFFIDAVEASEGVGTRLFWGREKREDLCWAGFELELRNQKYLTAMSFGYEVRFEEMGR